MSSRAVSLLIDQAVPRSVSLAVSQAAQPLRSTDVRKAFPGVVKPDLGRVTSALELLVTQGVLFSWPQSNRNAYWSHEPRAYLRNLIFDALRDKNRTAPELMAALKPKLFNLSRSFVAQELLGMQDEGALFLHPKLGRTLARYSLSPPDPLPYLRGGVESQLRALLGAGVSADAIQNAVRSLLVPPPAHVAWDGILLHEAAKSDPEALHGATLSLRELRRLPHLQPLSKLEFDRVVLDLARSGRVFLDRTDSVLGLTAEERELLVRDEHGSYYIGLSLAL